MTIKEALKSILQKLTSTKLWLTGFSCYMIFYIVTKKLVEFNNIALALCGVVVSYFVANVAIDKIFKS